ncbi:MAG: hypothetical protein RIC55_24355 [Pirellulaceae bacterium]
MSPETPPPRILQICPSWDTACGIANFAANLHDAAICQGAAIHTVAEPPADLDGYDAALIQHEKALYLRQPQRLHELLDRLQRAGLRRVLFAHSPLSPPLDHATDAYVAMCEGMIETDRPVHFMHHPCCEHVVVDRQALRKQLGLDRFRAVVASHGFVNPSRRFDQFVRRLAPIAAESNVAILLAVATNARAQPASIRALERLRAQAKRWPNVFVTHGYAPAGHVNALLQTADLTWCWTNTPSRPYASGVASDLYGGGARIVVADKLQHRAVCGRENVAVAPPDFEPFLEVLIDEMNAAAFPRHDPAGLSWPAAIPGLLNFLIGR